MSFRGLEHIFNLGIGITISIYWIFYIIITVSI